MKSKVNILLAEDDADDMLIISEAISEVLPVYNMHHAKNGYECIELLQEGLLPDIIFLDINLPIRNGYECLKLIKEMPSLDNTPVIMCSTSQSDKDIEECYKMGASMYMVKPGSFKSFGKYMKLAFNMLGKPRKEMLKKSNFLLKES